MATEQDKLKLVGKVAVSTEITPGPWSLPSIAQFGRGLLYALISAVLPIIYAAAAAALTGSTFVLPIHIIELTAITTGCSYIIAKIPQAAQQITTFKKPEPPPQS